MNQQEHTVEDIHINTLRGSLDYWKNEEKSLITTHMPDKNKLAWIKSAQEEYQMMITVLKASMRAARRRAATKRDQASATVSLKLNRPRASSFSYKRQPNTLDRNDLPGSRNDNESIELACSLREARRTLTLETDLAKITQQAFSVASLEDQLQASEHAAASAAPSSLSGKEE